MLPRLEHQAVRVVQATETAIVFGQISVACRKASRRERQRHAAVRKHFGLHAFRHPLQDDGQVGALHLQRNDPPGSTQSGHPLQRRQVVDIEVRSGNKRYFPSQTLHCTHIVGFHQKIAVAGDLVHGANLRTRLQQYLRRQHDFLASNPQALGDVEPIGQAQFMAAGADCFAQIDHIYGGRANSVVKIKSGFARPVVQQRTQRQFHGSEFLYFQGRWYAPKVCCWPSATLSSPLIQAGLGA